jgi:transcriptional regulator with XRE-family HTH domain
MRTAVIPKHALLDYLIEAFKLKNNRALAQHLGVTQSAISKIRYRSTRPSAEFILLVYDKTDMTIEEIRALIKKQEKLDGSDT